MALSFGDRITLLLGGARSPGLGHAQPNPPQTTRRGGTKPLGRPKPVQKLPSAPLPSSGTRGGSPVSTSQTGGTAGLKPGAGTATTVRPGQFNPGTPPMTPDSRFSPLGTPLRFNERGEPIGTVRRPPQDFIGEMIARLILKRLF